MNRFLATLYKEFLVLSRDKAGLALLFIMPVVLIIIMALIQDGPFKDYQEIKFEVLFVDQDHASLSDDLRKGLNESGRFSLREEFKGSSLTEDMARQLVQEGIFQFAIIIPQGSAAQVRYNASAVVRKLLLSLNIPVDSFGLEPKKDKQVRVLFDPAAKKTFKSSVLNGLDKFIARIETEMVLTNMHEQLAVESDKGKAPEMNDLRFISLKEINANPDNDATEIESNSVQHNVPAWTLFAMFFIVIPLGGALLKEREDGSLMRMRLMPGSFFVLLLGKVCFYAFICTLQFFLMLLVGIYLMPVFSLPSLQLGHDYTGLLLTAVSIAFASTSYGLLVGTVFKTPSQSLTFGSISVVLLSALGGIWIPLAIMPPLLRKIGSLSPFHWGLEAVNDLFLRQLELTDILPHILKLMIFGFMALSLSYFLVRKNFK